MLTVRPASLERRARLLRRIDLRRRQIAACDRDIDALAQAESYEIAGDRIDDREEARARLRELLAELELADRTYN